MCPMQKPSSIIYYSLILVVIRAKVLYVTVSIGSAEAKLQSH